MCNLHNFDLENFVGRGFRSFRDLFCADLRDFSILCNLHNFKRETLLKIFLGNKKAPAVNFSKRKNYPQALYAICTKIGLKILYRGGSILSSPKKIYGCANLFYTKFSPTNGLTEPFVGKRSFLSMKHVTHWQKRFFYSAQKNFYFQYPNIFLFYYFRI